MPTASEFRAAAGLLAAEAHTVRSSPRTVVEVWGPDVMQGGRLTHDVGAAVAHLESEAHLDGDALDDLAELCRDRAHACEEAFAAHQAWLADMARWEREMSAWRVLDHLHQANGSGPRPFPPTVPTQPTVPHDWIEF